VLRENLAELLEKEEEWTQAAQTLAGIDLDSGGAARGPQARPRGWGAATWVWRGRFRGWGAATWVWRGRSRGWGVGSGAAGGQPGPAHLCTAKPLPPPPPPPPPARG
jgi:hypothetical protein